MFAQYGADASKASFPSIPDLSFVPTSSSTDHGHSSQALDSQRSKVLSQHYEHSFGIHEDLPPFIRGTKSTGDLTIDAPADDFSTALSTGSEISPVEQLTLLRLAESHLSDLKDMPNSTYLQSIAPQTMTVNLVVGIISISQRRIIKTRQAGRLVWLVEMLVGDETRAGFCINIWIPSEQESNHSCPGDLGSRHQTLSFRPRDIILATKVALSSFRGKVYGQSLRRGWTTLDLLYRDMVDADDLAGALRARDLEMDVNENSRLLKLKRVKDWVTNFVGRNVGVSHTGPFPISLLKKDHELELLPNDTQ